MFHCNGWCFPWTIAALAGKNICMRKISSKLIFKLIKKYNVTHLCGTTVIINLLIKEGIKLKNKIEFMTGAAPPPPRPRRTRGRSSPCPPPARTRAASPQAG